MYKANGGVQTVFPTEVYKRRCTNRGVQSVVYKRRCTNRGVQKIKKLKSVQKELVKIGSLPGFSEIPPLQITAPGAVIWHDFPIYRPWAVISILKKLERREDYLDFPKYRPLAVIWFSLSSVLRSWQ